MKRSGTALWTALGVCLVILTATAVVLPWKEQTYSTCLYCGASKSELRILAIPVSSEEAEGALAQYWLKNVDPHHQHRWAPCASHSVGLLDGGYADSFVRSPVHTVLEDKTVVAILSALPSPSVRLELMNGLVDSWQGASIGSARKTARELKATYYADPNRKDWPEVLRKLGCYPATGDKP